MNGRNIGSVGAAVAILIAAAACSRDRSRPDPSTLTVPAAVPPGEDGRSAPDATGPPIVPEAGPMPSLAPLVARLRPSVVNIVTETVSSQRYVDPWGRRFYVPRSVRNSLGSGFLIDGEGRVLTNRHVIEDATSIVVQFDDGREVPAKLVGVERDIDLAVLDVDVEGLQWLELGDSDSAQVGDYVVAVGNALGLSNTVTAGIVSAVGREISSDTPGYADFIQTDASINQGNSGGPLVDLRGRVIGINTAVSAGGQGISFAIPINMAKQVLPQILAHGAVTRARLGILYRVLDAAAARKLDIDFSGASGSGLIWIADVVPDGPAAAAGLQPNDVILKFGGQPVDRPALFQWIASTATIGTPVAVEIWRDGRTLSVSVVPTQESE